MYVNRIEALFTWLGGGEWRELGERHERSTHMIAGVVVLVWCAALAVAGSTGWPMGAVVALTLVFGLLVMAVSRAISSGPTRGWSRIAGRAAVGLAVAVVVGELAAVVLFSGTIDRRLDEQATVRVDAAAPVAQASAELAADTRRARRTRRRGGAGHVTARRGLGRRAL